MINLEIEAEYQVQALGEDETLTETLKAACVGDVLVIGGSGADVIRKDDKEIKLKLINGSYHLHSLK